MALFNVLRGKKQNLPVEKKDGNLYVCTDTGSMYTDVGGTRIHLGGTKNAVISLTTAWTENIQTVKNPIFKKEGYIYTISPTYESSDLYSELGIKAKDVTIDGEITFVRKETPSTEKVINVNILCNEVN